jgi:GH24 family phage-related lysozyme (muramidase)
LIVSPTPEVAAAIVAFVTTNEGGSWLSLYLDTAGVVTIGVGLALFATEYAHSYGPGAAEAWETVHAAPRGMAAEWYAGLTPWRAQQADVDAVFAEEISARYGELVAQFPDAPTWPVAAQVATFDVAYQCGADLVDHWPHLSAALRSQDWREASEQCATDLSKGGVGCRNDSRKSLFLSCVASPPEAA